MRLSLPGVGSFDLLASVCWRDRESEEHCTPDIAIQVHCCTMLEEALQAQVAEREQSISHVIQWANRQSGTVNEDRRWACVEEPVVIFAVKSAATHLERRMSMRRTWVEEVLGSVPACVMFVVGAVEEPSMRWALLVERSIHADMLLGELQAEDHYHKLPQKMLAFFEWLVRASDRSSPFVVVLDDDVYVRLDRLLHLLNSVRANRFYAGSVYEALFQTTYRPIREPWHKNYLAYDDYPLEALPPYAHGSCYVLSFDLVLYLGRNARVLQPVGTLEDVSIAMWMLSLNVSTTWHRSVGFAHHLCRSSRNI
jgi:hypothetical protein